MMDKQKKHALEVLAAQIRMETLKIIGSLGFGHVGGSMSMADVLAVLYGDVLKYDPKDPKSPDHDWLVLSKGHAGPAMYAALGISGFYPVSDAYQLNKPYTDFPSHTDRNRTKGVDLTTGSLGQGISEAVGAALAFRTQGRPNRVFVAVGDGECDEGQVWEAAQFAAHYELDNLIVLVDHNKRQLDGPVDQIMSFKKGIGARFDSCGFRVIDVQDGNDVEQIHEAFAEAGAHKGTPVCVVLNTVKGKGASFAEPTGEHSSQPSKEAWEEAISLSTAAYEALKAEV